MLAPALGALGGAPDRVRLQACLVDARLHYDRGQATILVVEPLTAREREVLRHVSGMLSTAGIASKLDISIHTVKTHLKNIYRKLAATRRGQAVRRARQLELI